MPNSQPELILASTSPRRSAILARLQIPFRVISPSFEENLDNERSAKHAVISFAEGKARSVSTNLENAIVIGSDTLIEYEGIKIGKPENPQIAKKILQNLQGKTHRIWTGVFLIDTLDGSTKSAVEKVEVVMFPMTDDEIDDYIKTGEPLDKAGCYAVQGIGKKFIRELKGDLLAAIGLPLDPIVAFLKSRHFPISIN
ncbi:septum formation protein Maf [Nitrospira defluvii]|nr:septum formation protein Maf [Nitrospira defluvii]